MAEADETTQGEFRPIAPRRSADTGLSRAFLTSLILKSFYYRSDMRGVELARELRLLFSVVEEHLDELRREKLLEVKGADGGNVAAYRYGITQLGRERAREAIKVSQYVGPAPVTVDAYAKGITAQSGGRAPVSPETLEQGLSHLVLPRAVIQQIGPAINAQRALFLHGPAGNGKTVVAEAIGRALGGDLLIPHAVEVDGQVIQVADPIFHGEYEEETFADQASPARVTGDRFDERWVRVQRPVVFSGGELTLEMLDLNFNERQGFYEAPLQMKANGGVFIVDDFGRQLVQPHDLLNRWIVPLEKGVDFLSLHTGRKFPIPFTAIVIFATNLRPRDLVDEAFLRRIRYKVEMRDPTASEYREIFARECRARGIEPRGEAITFIYQTYYQGRGIPVRACHPRDIVEKVVEVARWHHQEPELSLEALELVCNGYFLE